MPAKKVPTEAAPKAADSPKNVKVDKPAGGGEKKAPAVQQKDNQPRGQRGPNGQQGKEHEHKQEQVQGQGQQQGQGGRPPISNDPGVAAVQKRLNDIDTKLEKHSAEMGKIKAALDKEEDKRKALVKKSQDIGDELKEFDQHKKGDSSQRGKIIEDLQERRRLVTLKRDEAAKIKQRLPNTPPKNMDNQAEQDTYLNQLQASIKAIESSLTTSASSLQAEKKKVEEISELRKAIKTFKEYAAISDKIREDNKYIADLSAELDKGKEARESNQGERQVFFNRRDEVSIEIEECKKRKNDINAKRLELVAQKDALLAEREKEKENLKAAKTSMREKQQQDYEKRQEERQRRDQEWAGVQAARDEKRRLEEEERDKQIPYEGEIELCEVLIKHLEGLLPKQKEEVAPAPAKVTIEGEDISILKRDDTDDGATGKKKYQKKQKPSKASQELRHNLDVYKQFESVSLTPPTKVSDVEASVNELKAKKEHYSKLSATAVTAKKEKAAAAAAAAETAKQEAAAAAAAATAAAATNNANNTTNDNEETKAEPTVDAEQIETQ